MKLRKTGRPVALTNLPEFNVFVFALLLNYPWELIQAPLYEGMAAARHWEAVKVCTRATLGDGAIMLLAYWVVAAAKRNRWWLLHPMAFERASFVAVGATVTIVLESLATQSDHAQWGWRYAEAMPIVPGIGVGLSPLLQWIILPLLLLWFVQRQLNGLASKESNRAPWQ